ncbi:MAG: VWA domain-containing protein, partial [Pirellulales bacterium]
MFNSPIDFEHPWYLCLLALVPLVWWLSRRSLSGLGPVRRWVVLLLRTTVMVALILALADMQKVRTSERVTVIYLLDQSRSIPIEQRRQIIKYFNSMVQTHRQGEDKVSAIVFGREAAIEIPPFDDNVQMQETIESLVDPDATNLEAAFKLAQGLFAEDSAKRVVVVSDGNQNLGNALQQARGLADAGIGIDVVPIRYIAAGDVSIEKVTVPSDVQKGQPFDLRVVVNNATDPTPDNPGIVGGDLIVYQKTDGQPVILSQEHVNLKPGKHVYTIRQEINQPDFYTYEARFVPDDAAQDTVQQNNKAGTFTLIRGSGQVLLIEDANNPGEFKFLVERLQANKLEVTVRPSNQMFATLPELQPFDTVILGNVPKEEFSEEQEKMLVRNTEFMGCGLIMLGGPNSFGAGGWANSEIEKALPVDCQIKNAKVVPKGALAMLMHASELAQGNFWQKKIADEALKTLGGQDYCGVLHWDGNVRWLWAPGTGMLRVSGAREMMRAKISQMTPGDMPDFAPAMVEARLGFGRLPDAAVKHMIIISDGDPAPPTASVIQGYINNKITISTVAVGTHGPAGSNILRQIANKTGGKYYVVNSQNALPRIFQKEARRVAKPLIHENKNGMTPQVTSFHEILNGIDDGLPPFTGYVMTTRKENPLVEIPLLAPEPQSKDNNTLLAAWTFGLGRSVAFTSDAGSRWTADWNAWGNYDKFFSQMVRWSMRPAGDQGKFTVSTDVQDEKVRVVVTALDKDDKFVNFLDIGASALGPDLDPRDIKLEQTAPGRYVGTFDAKDAGSYFLMLNPGAGQAPIRAGIDVPYSAEFKDRTTDDALLVNLAALQPKGGLPGKLIEDKVQGDGQNELLA